METSFKAFKDWKIKGFAYCDKQGLLKTHSY